VDKHVGLPVKLEFHDSPCIFTSSRGAMSSVCTCTFCDLWLMVPLTIFCLVKRFVRGCLLRRFDFVFVVFPVSEATLARLILDNEVESDIFKVSLVSVLLFYFEYFYVQFQFSRPTSCSLPILPDPNCLQYNLRPRQHSFSLFTRTDDQNIITRQVLYDSY